MPIEKPERKNPYDKAPKPDFGGVPTVKTKHGEGSVMVEDVGAGIKRVHVASPSFSLRMEGSEMLSIHQSLVEHGINPDKLSQKVYNKLFKRRLP